ncbi:MAG: hypothetical protein U9Q85_04595, partial [Patescibacteria group bacterium]|nr:hypothetical protein [Patescibacteria group bacterium]
MPKNVDGIKKLSKEELEKSRKIVLDSIGEGKVPDKPKIDNKSEKIKSVDSVFSKKIIKKTKIPIKPTNFLKPHDEDDPEENIKEKDKSSSLVSKVNPFANEIIKKRIEESEEKNKQEKREQDKRKKEEEQKETEER